MLSASEESSVTNLTAVLTLLITVGGGIWAGFATIIMLRVKNSVLEIDVKTALAVATAEQRSNSAIASIAMREAATSVEITEIRNDVREIKAQYLDTRIAEAKLETIRAEQTRQAKRIIEVEEYTHERAHWLANKVQELMIHEKGK